MTWIPTSARLPSKEMVPRERRFEDCPVHPGKSRVEVLVETNDETFLGCFACAWAKLPDRPEEVEG